MSGAALRLYDVACLRGGVAGIERQVPLCEAGDVERRERIADGHQFGELRRAERAHPLDQLRGVVEHVGQRSVLQPDGRFVVERFGR